MGLMNRDDFIHFTVPADTTENCIYCEMYVGLDEDGDVMIASEDGTVMFSYAQAHALLLHLGQKLKAFDRSFGFKHGPLKVVNND